MPKPENVLPYLWKKGQSGNPKGRPSIGVKRIVEEIKAAGYEAVKPVDVRNVIESILALPIDAVSELVKDDKQPAIVRIVCKQILDKNKGFDALQTLLDRAHGKPTQTTQLTGKDGEALPPIQILVTANAPIATDD